MSVIEMASSLFKGVKGIPRSLFGSRNDRLIKEYVRKTNSVSDWEDGLRGDYDERFSRRVASEAVMDAPEEEREAMLQKIRCELSGELLSRTESLRDPVQKRLAPLGEWWNALDASQRVEEYHKDDYRKRYQRILGELDEEGVVEEAFAVLREASRRAQNHRHFDCQLVGGRVLSEGKIAEMRTGEGKTIVCHLAAYLQILCGHKVHIITVNDYLVQRDAEFARPIFELVGMTVGYIQAQVDPSGREGIRQRAYGCDITYGTNSEFGFDYLRDNMKTQWEDQVQGKLDFVIVDEVDSILIDEARTPLIISGPARDDVTRYPRADKVAEELSRRQAVWDRKIRATVAKYDGDARNIAKLGDAMAILGYKERRESQPEKSDTSDSPSSPAPDANQEDKKLATLGPDFLTDDQVEAIQIYEATVLHLPAAERYRRYFIVQMERKQVGITHEGVTIAQELLDLGSLYSGANMEWPHLIENALRAHKVYRRDTDYVVQGGEVIIVDAFTGRLMHGRQWSEGLHQAIEAKERVKVKEETQTLATITIQNFIKLYRLKAGMTGTALTEATEFDKIYRLEVVSIPTNRPVNRADYNDKMYRSTEQKYDAIVEEIHEIQMRGRPADPFVIADSLTALQPILSERGDDTGRVEEALRQFHAAEADDKKVVRFLLEVYDEAMGDLARGRPILVGTTSVENSEKLSRLLDQRYGIEHEVLNAKNHAREAEIIAKAGQTTVPTHVKDQTPHGNVTIATNMAGRGTDIKLGLDVVYPTCKVPAQLPEGVLPSPLFPAGTSKCCIHCEEYDPVTNCAHCYKPKIDPRFPRLGRTVCPTNVPCGLHIIAAERHESRRIDNQLRGRAGRQGDPGSSRFSLSLQDDLLKLFMSDWMLKMMERLGFTDGSSLEDKRLTKGIERAQRKVEERNFSTRKHLLEWDEPMDFQRKEFYTARQRILEQRDLPTLIFRTIDNAIDTTLSQYLSDTYVNRCIAQWCHTQLDLSIEEAHIDTEDFEAAQESIRRRAKEEIGEQITTSLGEYIDPEEPPDKWDVGGLLHWAQRMFKISLTQNQLRKMDPDAIEEFLLQAAETHYDEINLGGIAIYLDPRYPQRALAEWARGKFNVSVEEEELLDKSSEEIGEMLRERVRQVYRRRETDYPVEACLERAYGTDGVGSALAAEFIAGWANAKYLLGWKAEDLQDRPPQEIHDTLVDYSRRFFETELEQEIDRTIAGDDRAAVEAWARSRFGPAWNPQSIEKTDGDLKQTLLRQGRDMLRWELTRLEQFVLLRIYDQGWKDHLLEMDHLKTAIMQRPLGGDQSHPQSQYAIEGRDLFSQMWARIAVRVTDIIFKVRTAGDGGVTQGTSSPGFSLSHSDATGLGFASAARDRDAAMQAQGVEGKVATIRREQPKVGRNAPCPCGSGKKYKNCHGKV